MRSYSLMKYAFFLSVLVCFFTAFMNLGLDGKTLISLFVDLISSISLELLRIANFIYASISYFILFLGAHR